MRKIALLLLVLLPLAIQILGHEGTRKTLVIKVEGDITPGIADFISSAINLANRERYEAIVLVINTNGGLLASTEKIIDSMAEAYVPVGVYVPRNGRAFSAGSYILMASDVAGMAQGATVGAAMPIPPEQKVIEAMSGWMRSLAESTGRPAEIAERMVRENLVLTAGEALDSGVIQHISPTLSSFIEDCGFPEEIVEMRMDFGSYVLVLISTPVIAWLLLVLGGLIFIVGLKTPGLFMEWAGGIMVLLGLYGLGQIGIGPGALALMLLGITAMLLELKTGQGFLAVGGMVMAVFGLILMYRSAPLLRTDVDIYMFSATGIIVAGLVGFYLHKIKQTLSLREMLLDPKKLIGEKGIVKKKIPAGGTGIVLVKSELWSATSEDEIEEGSRVEVVGISGLRLIVRKTE
ncbi:MAG: hypothetical protein DRN90_05910 [Thermoproteota archaeon]|nr:MAG: hypothetical protein DRN90_05910 [Candidatus Korarchaeota archaeon]